MNNRTRAPVVYRIAHRLNYPTVNLVNALTRFIGFQGFHFLTYPTRDFLPERSFFSVSDGITLEYIDLDNLRLLNQHLAMAPAKRFRHGIEFSALWPFEHPEPDLLVINLGAGVVGNVMEIFPRRPKTIFYAECFSVADFYPRPEWPMPQSVVEINTNYRKRALAYAEQCDAIVVPSNYAKALIINPPTLGANRGGGNKTEQGLTGQISTGSSRYWAVL